MPLYYILIIALIVALINPFLKEPYSIYWVLWTLGGKSNSKPPRFGLWQTEEHSESFEDSRGLGV